MQVAQGQHYELATKQRAMLERMQSVLMDNEALRHLAKQRVGHLLSPPPPLLHKYFPSHLLSMLQETELLAAQQELDLLRGDLQSQRHLQVRTDAQGDAVDWKHTAEVDAAGLLAPGVAGGSAPGGDNKIESAVGQGPRRERRGAAAGEARGQGAREEAMHCMQRTDKAAGPAQTAPACFIFPP